MRKKKAIIVGAGPAGLTAAYELLKRTDIRPVIFEETSYIGGISRTVNYKGNRIDIGGHRFFSKSDRVMKWWEEFFPLQSTLPMDELIWEREKPQENKACDSKKNDKIMLVRKRLSRIYFLRKFFDYPISLKWQTFSNLGLIRVIKIVTSYLYVVCFPIKEEKSLEDFFINRFGKELYKTFFKDYTEKVWGVPCKEIKPEWGSQRIKGLSISKTIFHALKVLLTKNNSSIKQKKMETSLIEQFLYPKYGPGQLWEEVASKIREKGGTIFLNHKVVCLEQDGARINRVFVKHEESFYIMEVDADFVFSTMPVKDLILSMTPSPPENVQKVAQGLVYRDFITVGLLVKKLKIKNESKRKTLHNIIPDNWIYIQERDVKLGRIQIFNNWSPYLVQNPNMVWLGLEYFASEGDELWSKKDKELTDFAAQELIKIGFCESTNYVLDSVVIRTPKAYPAYFGSYEMFHVIREFTDKIENLFLVGRNGMHRYNNQDHSMLTAMKAVDNILNNKITKENIWEVNIENEYHEEN